MTRQAKRAARLSCQRNSFQLKTLSVAVAVCLGGASPLALANPTGASVANGSATFATQGNTLTITNSNGAIINWQQFNIEAGETTRFVQPNAQSSVLNQVVGGDPSKIFGTLQSNGQVFLINPNGILFGKSAVIDVPGLIASTLKLSDADFLAGRRNFAGGGLGSLVNQGRISTSLGGSVWLIGSDVRNEGIITTPQGRVVLAAGDSVSLIDTAGPELSVTLTASGNKALNLGEINAAGGRIDMFGALIEQQGVLRADSASVDDQGRIVLKASDSAVVSGTVSAANSAGQGGTIQVLGKSVTLTGTASLDASGAAGGGTVRVGGDWQGKNPDVPNAQFTTMAAGATIKADATGQGNGGKVVLWSDNTTDFKGSIFARGGANGGDGGQVETSGHRHLLLGGRVNTLAPRGTTGTWLLDPAMLCIDDTGYCSNSLNLYSPYQHGGSTADIWTTSDLNTYLLSQTGTTGINLFASDYIAFLPNGGTWQVPALSSGSGYGLDIQAPHVYFNGTLDFRTNGVALNTYIHTNGASSTSLPSLSDSIVLDSTAKWLLPAGAAGQTYAYHGFDAGTVKFEAGSVFDAPYSLVTDTVYGYSYPAGDGLNIHANTLFKANGGSVRAAYVSFYLGAGADFLVTTPLAVDAYSLFVNANNPVGFQIGTDDCTLAGLGCWGDATKYFSGTWNTLAFHYGGTGDLSIVGNFNPGNASHVSLWSANQLTVAAPITYGDYFLGLGGARVQVSSSINGAGSLALIGNEYTRIDAPVTVGKFLLVEGGTSSYSAASVAPGLYINQPLKASYIDLMTGPAGRIELNSTLTATGQYFIPHSSSATGDGVGDDANADELISIDLGADYYYGGTASPTRASSVFVNTAGADAISVGKGFWHIDAPAGATVDLGGLPAKQMTWDEVKAGGYVPWYDKLTPTEQAAEDQHNANITFYAGGSPSSKATTVDPCAVDPALCATTSSSSTTPAALASPTTATATTVSPLSAPLTIDATLTVDDSKSSSSLTTTQTAATSSSTLDARLTVNGKDDGKSAADIRAEAGKAREDAIRAEAEAKRAEAEVKEAEATAKAARTPAEKAAARQKAEAKKAEAEAKKAQAEAKQAEAEAKQSEAEKHEAAAEGKGTETPEAAAAKRSEAEAKQIQAEGKQAEAEARQAEAESKQAAIEAKAAKDPDQKAAALKTAEAKKIEAEAKKTEAEAKKVEAEAKQAEADAKTAPTPEARAAAEKRAETKQAQAEVKKTEAESKQAQAESKQAEAQGKQAEVRAKAAQAEAKQAEAEAKAAKTPEEKQAATQKAEVKKTEAEAHKIESEARKTEAEAKQTEAEAKKAEVEVKKAEAEVKQAKAPEQKAAAEKRAETKRVEAEVKKTEAESKQAQAESKQAEAQGKQAEVRAKEAQAEAKQAEAEAKSAKAPEEKLAATQKAEVKKTEAEAHKTESEARKAEAEGKKIEAEAKKAEVEVKKAEAEAKQAKAPEQKAAAEKKVEAKQAEVEAKKTAAEAKHTEAQAKQAQAEAKQAEAEAKGSRSPGGRAVAEKQAEAKRAEGEHKAAEAAVKKAEAEVKKAEAIAKKAEGEGKKAEAQARKAEAEAKKAEVEAKRAEAEKKKVEALKKAEAFRLAAEKRKEQRRIESAKAFAAVATGGANRAALENLVALRHELKTEALKPALSILASNPGAADLPPCGSGSAVCVPVAAQAAANLPPPPVPKFAFLPQIQRKVAVVVGVNQYTDPAIPSLESALPDAEAVGQQLKEQLGYDVRVVADATRADIVTSLNKLSQEVGPNDSVTVYYAGHGYLNEKTKTGYWIPADAKATSPANWISNNDIAKLLANIPAKQVMLVSDSCYSGSLTKEQKISAGAGSLDPTGILSRRSVTIMSSGGEEPVSDEGKEGHSIFAYSFMNALKSVKQVDSGVKLFDTVKNEVSKDFPQTPQYGGAISAGHTTGGDYLFEARSYQ